MTEETNILKYPVYNAGLEEILHKDIPEWLSEQEERPDIINIVHTYLRNKRRSNGNGGVLRKHESSYSTRKIRAQKGSGGARHGSRRVGLMRKGCKAHGPSGEVNHVTKINKKVRKLALVSMFSNMIRNNRVIVFEDAAFDNIEKTSHANTILNKVKSTLDSKKIENRKSVFVVDEISQDKNSKNLARSVDNIADTRAVQYTNIHVASMLRSDFMVISSNTFDKLITRLSSK